MSNSMSAILDYGVGNVRSIQSALRALGEDSIITRNHGDIIKASRLILPGVGSFPAAMSRLLKQNLEQSIRDFVTTGKPILGICLGMQLLMDTGEEFEETPGLGFVDGRVVSLEKLTKNHQEQIPNIGWYQIKVSAAEELSQCNLLEGVDEIDSFYFVHSYVCEVSDVSQVAGITNFYDADFCSALATENIYGVQFHPEKSGKSGLKVLQNFVRL